MPDEPDEDLHRKPKKADEVEGEPSKPGPRNYRELGKLGGEARKRQLMGGAQQDEE
jgi:hypothetical protein